MKTQGLRSVALSVSELSALLDAAVWFGPTMHYEAGPTRANRRRDNALRRAVRKLQRAAPKEPQR